MMPGNDCYCITEATLAAPGMANLYFYPIRRLPAESSKEAKEQVSPIRGLLRGFTPLEKATDSCRWYKSFLRDGGSMPPSLLVREHSSLTGFTYVAMRILSLIRSNCVFMLPSS